MEQSHSPSITTVPPAETTKQANPLIEQPKNDTKMVPTTNETSAPNTSPPSQDPPTNIIKTQLRIIYNNIDDNFNIIDTHCKLLKLIKDMDNDLIVYPNDSNSKEYSDLTKVPTTEDAFRHQFTVLDSNRNRVIVCITIGITSPFASLKYTINNMGKQESALFTFMKTDNIIIRQDKFDKQATNSAGFFIKINPDVVHRNAFHSTIEDSLNCLDINSTC
jgi:hypothetical protein